MLAAIFYLKLVVAIIQDYSCQQKPLKLVYVLSVLSKSDFYLLWQKKLSYVFIHLLKGKKSTLGKHAR